MAQRVVEAKFSSAIPHCFDPIDARQDEPVVGSEIIQRSVEGLEGTRSANLDEWDFQDLGSELAELHGKRAGLMAGAAYENAGAFEGLGEFSVVPTGLEHRFGAYKCM
jgi:hypothetical protein